MSSERESPSLCSVFSSKDRAEKVMSGLQEEIAFNFLSDDPGIEDGFSGKGHERSARMLAAALVKFAHDDCSIGLEGSWGSGKTTVVAIAEQQLRESQSEKFTFFTFDLWANQGVDFRRAFLEEFLRWSKPYLGKKYAVIERRVQGKTKTVETESEREFSVFGYILMSALFFLPFLVLWLSPFSANLHRPSGDAGINNSELPWVFRQLYEYGHVAAIALVSIVIVGFLYQTCCLWKSKGSLRKALDASFSLFARKSDKDTVVQTIRDGDPTQYEFHEIFTQILSSIQGDKRRVIFVIDNIDRLPSDRIQETWANVRSIFSRARSEGRPSNSSVTAVVPYDRAQVLSAFEGQEVQPSNLADQKNSAIQSPYVLEDVIRKTFNAVVTVSPPVTSHVKDFFDNCLDHSLPDQFSDGQKYRLFQIFDFFLTETTINPTPRQVKSFVNDVGMLWYQWREAVSIEAIAVFVLHRSKLEADPRTLQDPGTIHDRYRHFVISGDLDRDLAALAYNVEPEIAFEVLLERDITAALLGKSSDRLSELSASAGFTHQLDRILHKNCVDWASTSLNDFEAALANYSQLSINISVKELCDKNFIRSLSSLTKFDLAEWEAHRDLFKIASCIPKGKLIPHVQEIAEWLAQSLPGELTHELGRAWINFFGGFLQEVGKVHGQDAVDSAVATIQIPDSPDFYIGVALDCDEVDLHFSQFQSAAKQQSSEISSQLASYGIELPKHFYYVWCELQYALQKTDRGTVFAKLLEQVQSSILDGDKERQMYLNNLVLVAASSRSEASVVNGVKAAISDGTLPWHAAKLNEAKDWGSLAKAVWLAAIAIKTDPVPGLSAASKSPFGDVTASHTWFGACYGGQVPVDTLGAIAELVIAHDKVDLWLTSFAKAPKHTMYKDVLIEVLGSDNCPALDLQTLIEQYAILKKSFAEEAVAEMVKRVGQGIGFGAIEKIDISVLPPALVKDIDSLSVVAWMPLLSRVDQYLKDLAASDWEEALNEDNHNRKLLLARNDKLYGMVPPNHLRAALADFVAGVMSSKEVDGESLKDHAIFWSVLPKSSRKGLSSDLFERISGKPLAPEGVVVAISSFPGLFAGLSLKDYPDVAVSKILLQLLADSLDRSLEYVEMNHSSWAKCVESIDSETRAQLDEYLAGFDDKEEEVVAKVDRLRKLLKMRKPSKKPELIQTEEPPTGSGEVV
jgi:hypothetical protein